MKINIPDFIYAEFFMKDELHENINTQIISPSQVHKDNIICIDDNNFSRYALPERPESDGILLTTTKIAASLRFADCAPVLIWSEFWAMLLHSGYKGTVLNISARGVEMARKKFGDKSAKNYCAWIGPCIGREDYERKINDDWSTKGMNTFHSGNYDVKHEHVYFDLANEIKSQLLESGLNEKNIMLLGINTFRDSKCYSYRRGDKTERMTLYVKLKQTH